MIPKAQPDTQALRRLIWTLQHGQVEIRESTAPVTVDGKTYPAGSYVVLTKQPFGAYAKALLERQQYPDLFDYPGGPPKRPYDVTAHTLPLLFGVDVAHVTGARRRPVHRSRRLPEPTYTSALSGKATKRIALFRPSTNEPIDEGWTHWIFDTYKIPFTTITEKDFAPARRTIGSTRSSSPTAPWRRRRSRRARRTRRASGGAATSSRRSTRSRTTAAACSRSTAARRAMIDGLKLPVKNVLAGVA